MNIRNRTRPSPHFSLPTYCGREKHPIFKVYSFQPPQHTVKYASVGFHSEHLESQAFFTPSLRRVVRNAGSLISSLCIAMLSTGCGFDPASPEYDERRYTELQKANCNEIASAGSSKLIDKTPEKPEVILARCRALQQLTLEEYRRAADYARRHDGQWNIEAALGTVSSGTPDTTP